MYSYTPSLTSAIDGVGGQRHAPTSLSPGNDAVPHCIEHWVVPKAGLDGIRTPNRPSHSELLCRLSATGNGRYIRDELCHRLILPTAWKLRGNVTLRRYSPLRRTHATCVTQW